MCIMRNVGEQTTQMGTDLERRPSVENIFTAPVLGWVSSTLWTLQLSQFGAQPFCIAEWLELLRELAFSHKM